MLDKLMFLAVPFDSYNVLNQIPIENLLGPLAGFLMGMALLLAIVGVILYVYYSLALQTIAKKLKHKYPWLAWIPGANIALVLQLGGFHWALVFLMLIPVLGWIAIGVLSVIAFWRIFVKRKYPGWFSLIPLASIIPFVGFLATIATLVIIGLVAWKDK